MSTASTLTERCRYVFRDGSRCPGAIEGEGHSASGMTLQPIRRVWISRIALERWARRNRSLEGIILRYASWQASSLEDRKR